MKNYNILLVDHTDLQREKKVYIQIICLQLLLLCELCESIYVSLSFLVVLVMIGGVNLLCGTWSYLHNILTLVKRKAMSIYVLVPTFALGTLHVCLWFLAIALYMGVIEIEEEEEENEQDKTTDLKKKYDGSQRGKKP